MENVQQRRVTLDIVTDAGDGATLIYFAKGHIADDSFRQALAREDPGSADLQEAPVLHAWWRWVPGGPGDDFGVYQHDAQPHARGAFEVTYVNVPEQRRA